MKPVLIKWDEAGERPVIHPNDLALFRKQYNDGRWHKFVELEMRSPKEHKQFFAVLAEAWAQYPEDYRAPIIITFEDPETQREKFRAESLLDCGFYTEQESACASESEAARWAWWWAKHYPFSRAIVDGPFVKIRFAKSMAIDETGKNGMLRKEFRRVKQALFEHWANAIGINVDELVRQSEAQRYAS